MSDLTKAFDQVFKDLRTDPYASEAETAALIKPDTRAPEEKRLHTMMDERGAWEQGVDSISVLRDIALELLNEQTRTPVPSHPDDLAVDRFAAAMKAKMAKQRAKGYGGWDKKDECPAERLQTMLAEHLAKGDPVDVGNFAMMLFAREEKTTAAPAQIAGFDVVIDSSMPPTPTAPEAHQEPVAKFTRWGERGSSGEGYTVEFLGERPLPPDGTLFYTAAQTAPLTAQGDSEALECEIISADFGDNTITVEMKSKGWKVRAGTYWLGTTLPPVQDNQNHGDI